MPANLRAPLLLLIIFSACFNFVRAEQDWQTLDDGLELGYFKSDQYAPTGDSIITILRVDPRQWDLRILSLTGTQEPRMLSARVWSEKFDLVAATNAGMFNEDYRAHTGYMRCGPDVNNPRVNSYKSVAAFSPRDSTAPPFHIFDLDQTSIDSIRSQFSCMVQNLRLIDRARRNRWSQQASRWSESALGEDEQGRALFIFCRSPYSMHDFNNILLSLPIDLVCAQHLEGGPEAQLYLQHEGTTIQLIGSYETGFMDDDANSRAWPVPNVIGISKKHGGDFRE